MVRPQIHPIYAAASGLVVFGLLEAVTVPLADMGHISSMSSGGFNIYALFIALADWLACIACVFIGMKLSRSEPVVTASFLAMILAVWHLFMIFSLFSFAQVLSDSIVPYSVVYYGGLLVTGAVLVMGYERRTAKGTQANRRALADLARQSVYGEALATAGLLGSDGVGAATAENGASGSKLPRAFELTEAEERSASFFDLDLIMLEAELLKMKPDRDGYISALRLGIAIEKDMGFVNCRARTFTFAELMKDVCTRLSVTLEEEGQWPGIAEGFRQYGVDDRLVRRNKIASCEDALMAAQLHAALRSERPEGLADGSKSLNDAARVHRDDPDMDADADNKILASVK
ncbi:MAG: hypothetical protein KGS72_03775 [Cyanobacteria bacterium REEB67]|nr:hypothetical protein [Cyanobacteria bacterium REEB67]